jgi:hypothetical protein
VGKNRIYNELMSTEEQMALERVISELIQETSGKIPRGAPCSNCPTRDGIRQKLAIRILVQLVRRLRPDLLVNPKKKTIQIMLSEDCSFDYNTHRFATARQADRFIDKCEAEGRASFGPFELEIVLPINSETGLVREDDVRELLREAVNSTH